MLTIVHALPADWGCCAVSELTLMSTVFTVLALFDAGGLGTDELPVLDWLMLLRVWTGVGLLPADLLLLLLL